MADAPESPRALPWANKPLPDLPTHHSHDIGSNSTAKSVAKNPPAPTSNLSAAPKSDGLNPKAWVAHTDGRTTTVEAQPDLKAALPVQTQQHLEEQQTERKINQGPIARELAQAAKAKEPVAWVAHKDGRLEDKDAAPKLADALPAKVSEKLSKSDATGSQRSKGFFGKVGLTTCHCRLHKTCCAMPESTMHFA